MAWGYALAKLTFFMIFLFALIGVGATVINNTPMSPNFLTGYLTSEDRGVRMTNETNLDVAAFYRDIVAVDADAAIIEECQETDDFRACMEANAGESETMRNIRHGVDTAAQYGIDYAQIPFVSDLLG